MDGKENKTVKNANQKLQISSAGRVPAKTDNAKRKIEHVTLPVIKIRSSTNEYNRQDKNFIHHFSP